MLAKAGGEIAAKEVEEKLQTIYDKIGLAGIKYIFKEDGTYSYILKKRTVSGTYVFDDEAKTITMKNKSGWRISLLISHLKRGRDELGTVLL